MEQYLFYNKKAGELQNKKHFRKVFYMKIY